ncbi:MAG TPA: single-stranded-DNA-specific exonuclease RecJ, partial [Alphaproteobacteria bacterium]|nr:single-stranded-DNA-specific exonuclease RecJ [Alphaproteobacteria bacterium]
MIVDSPRFFLDVEESVTGRPWTARLDAAAARTAAAISQRTDISEVLSRIIAGRGVGVDEAERFLLPTIRELMPDPSTLADMDLAADRLARAILDREPVALLGDYDVDGACACALFTRYLRHFGIAPEVYIPDRIFEGYGPNTAAMEKLIGNGASLIVTLDCGTVSDEPIAHARARGIDVVVVDHHLSDAELPPATAIVNPNRADDVSGLGYLCGAGVAFMTLVATNRVLRNRGVTDLPDLMNLSDLVALATICDVVPLKGLNRAFVQRGLEVARRQQNRGIAALGLAARISGPLNPYHLGYLIGPRINAGGRIGNAALGAELLSLEDEHESLVLASRLSELNDERQRIELAALEEATAAAAAEIGAGEGPPVLILASARWHPGIVGLIAARLRERFDRPVFAIALGADGTGTGSGRSVPGVDLGSAVIAAVEQGIIAKGGGHAMAAGVTIRPGQMAGFRAYITEALGPAATAARARR